MCKLRAMLERLWRWWAYDIDDPEHARLREW
jgi:hypothetical protein